MSTDQPDDPTSVSPDPTPPPAAGAAPPVGAPPWARRTPPSAGGAPPTAPAFPPVAGGPPPGWSPPPGPAGPSPFGAPPAGGAPVAPPGPAVAPSAVTAEHLAAGAGWAAASRPATSVHHEYTRFATSPLWWMLASIAVGLVGVAVWVVTVVGVSASADDATLSDGAAAGLGVGTIAAIVLLFASWVLSIMWIYTIGQNAGTYGLGLMIATWFPIYLVPLLFLGPTVFTIGLLVWACWPYRLLVTGIWTAGRLPRAWAIVGWAPIALGLVLVLGAWLTVESSSDTWGDGASTGDAAALWVVGNAITGIGSVFVWAAILTVTIIQHVGIRNDRRRREEARQADRGGFAVR